MKKAKIGSYLVVCGADYFKSYIGNIGTIIGFCNSRDAIRLRFNDGEEIVFDAKYLSLIEKQAKKQKKIVDGIDNICPCWKCALNRTVKENERLGIFRKPSLKKG